MAAAGATYYFVLDHAANTAATPGEIEVDQDTTRPFSTFVDPPSRPARTSR
jgi:hypothetical protein